MMTLVWRYVQSCAHCQLQEIPRKKSVGYIEAIPVSQAFEMIHINVFGPVFRSSEGSQYITVCGDYPSEWVETKAAQRKPL